MLRDGQRAPQPWWMTAKCFVCTKCVEASIFFYATFFWLRSYKAKCCPTISQFVNTKSIRSLDLAKQHTNPHQISGPTCLLFYFACVSRGPRMGKSLGGASDLVLSNRIPQRTETDLLWTNRNKARLLVGSTRACWGHVHALRAGIGFLVEGREMWITGVHIDTDNTIMVIYSKVYICLIVSHLLWNPANRLGQQFTHHLN